MVRVAEQKSFAQRVTSETLPPLCTVMWVSYLLMAAAHVVFLPPGTPRLIMIGVALATSAVAFFVGRWLQVAQSLEMYATVVVGALIGLIVLNTALHMGLLQDPTQTPLFALTIAASGFFIASLLLLAGLIAAILGIWWLVYASIGDLSMLENYLFLLALSSAVSLTLSLARMRNLRRLEAARLRAAQQLQVVGQDRRIYLQGVLQSLEPGLCAVDSNGYVALVNTNFAALLDATPENLTGQRLADVPVNEALVPALSRRLTSPVEVVFGNNRTLRFSESRLPSENGIKGGRLILATDISSRKHLEQEREQLLRSAQEAQRLAALGSSAGRMAHDFNNHLAIISGSLEMLGIELPGNAHVSAGLEATQQAAALTRQLQGMAKQRDHAPQRLHLATLIEDTLTLIRGSAPRGIELQSRFDDADLYVSADPQQLEQVFVNLTMNAAESYQGAEGTVTIVVASSVNPSNNQAIAEVRISDDGCGIDSATYNRLYEPFVTTKGPGRGLGLSASVEILQAIGGTLDVRSAAGTGTTVVMLLPTCEAPGIQA